MGEPASAFWLSLFLRTGWMGENHFARGADRRLRRRLADGGDRLLRSCSEPIIAPQGAHSLLAAAVGSDWKGKLSLVLYLAAIPLAFVNPWIAHRDLMCWSRCMWLVPDRRIERVVAKHRPAGA